MKSLKIIAVITITFFALSTVAQTLKESEKPGPEAYYVLAKSSLNSKNYQDAIVNFEKVLEYADQAASSKIADTSRLYLAGIYIVLGNSDMQNDELDKALEEYNRALSYKPGYYKAYYGMGLVYKKQENLPLMKEALDQAISSGGDDLKTIGYAKDAAASAFQKAGAEALEVANFTGAIENLTSSLEYNNTEPRTYLYIAIAYNNLLKWDNAISEANKALQLQKGDKSDIYFELGKSYAGKGDLSKTCFYYSQVKTGSNATLAKYQVEKVLQCKPQ